MPNRLKELRNSKGLSMKQMSTELVNQKYFDSITDATLSNYENEKREPKLETWVKLAKYFDVDVAYLQGFSSIPKIPNGSVIRKYDSSLKKVVNSNNDLPDDVSLFQVELEEQLSYNAQRVTPLLHSLFPKSLADEWDENLISYADRAHYFMAMQTASSAFLALLENPNDASRSAVNSMILDILNSIDDLETEDSLNLKSFIQKINEVKKYYTSPENYDNNEFPLD
ncbi:helix-turn-helix transcriptional regulator [Leuconostoc citreum]|uniref:helix-turn-helix domain-containing protein n=1 Tax=Leuconostoc citreum TaxID=33964 RepID=UPI003134260B